MYRAQPPAHAWKQAIRRWVAGVLVLGASTFVGCAGTSVGSASKPSQNENQIKINIAPSSVTLPSGTSQQFAAEVTGTAQTSVTWSATAGTISQTGLLTAPSVAQNTTVTVTATSVTDSQKTASATVNVTPLNQALAITTASLPPAMIDTNYDSAVSATGGEQPYLWSVASGSLPSGITLDSSTGQLSGTAIALGQSSFVVELKDHAGKTAQQGLELSVIAASVCGPPAYPCSRTDTDTIIPAHPPQLGTDASYYGGHLGAGSVAIDPDYGNRILRVTDANSELWQPGRSFNTSSSAEQNITSYDESLFLFHDEGGRLCLFQFDQANFQATYRNCTPNVDGDGAEFGYTVADNRAIYTFVGTLLERLLVDPANGKVAADPQFNGGLGGFDPNNSNCLDGQVAANNWYVHDRALSSDDQTVIVSVGPEQDADPYIVVWNAAKGCEWLNVQTWQVSRGWNTGLSNPQNISWVSGAGPTKAGGVHNVQIDRSGAFGVLTIVGTTLANKVFWTFGTNEVNDTCDRCVSHWACDFAVCLWDFEFRTMFDMRSLPIQSDMGDSAFVKDMDNTAADGYWQDDEHASHANAEPAAKNIYLVSWQPGGAATIESVWDDEITGISWDGSRRTIRFAKNWNSGFSFWATARCQISRQGHFAICGSDYQMYNLDEGFGNGLNQNTCDHTLQAGNVGTNGCRTDVLLFELR
jgi:hypothetical protein